MEHNLTMQRKIDNKVIQAGEIYYSVSLLINLQRDCDW